MIWLSNFDLAIRWNMVCSAQLSVDDRKTFLQGSLQSHRTQLLDDRIAVELWLEEQMKLVDTLETQKQDKQQELSQIDIAFTRAAIDQLMLQMSV